MQKCVDLLPVTLDMHDMEVRVDSMRLVWQKQNFPRLLCYPPIVDVHANDAIFNAGVPFSRAEPRATRHIIDRIIKIISQVTAEP